MELNEALSIAEQVETQYQAFRKMAEVLKVARSVEQRIREGQLRISDITKEETEAGQRLAEVLDQVKSAEEKFIEMKNQYDADRKTAEQNYSARMLSLVKEMEEKMAESKALFTQAEKDRTIQRAEFEQEEREWKNKIATLKFEFKNLQEKAQELSR